MKKILKIGGIIIVVLIVLGILAGGGDTDNTKTSNSKESVAQQTQGVKEATKISAQELADDFDENQVAAEDKWKGKLVEFSAEITNITDTGLSFSNVASQDFSMAQISCKITDKQQLLSLKKGQIVAVKGVVGSQTIGVISVKDCSVIQ